MKKVGYFFFSFLPLLASVGLQFAAVFPVMGFYLIQTSFSYIPDGKKIGYSEFLMHLSSIPASQNFSMIVSILYAACGILIFGIWYIYQFQGSLQFPTKQFSNPPLIAGLILLVPGLQMASSVLTGISSSFFPGWMDFYEKLMENAGFTNEPSALLILYAVLLGPIAEELTFRGVVFSSAKKVFPFWAANLFQALLFGIFHMNLIQGIYAFFIGLFLGYVCGRGGSIWLSICLHILFNAWGTFMSANFYSVLFFILSILLGILGLYLFHKNTSVESVNHLPDFSDM